MKIGQVATASGLPIQTIRFYEGRGQAKRLGLSLGEIKDILAITDQGDWRAGRGEVLFDRSQTSEEAILDSSAFRSYEATVLSVSS